MTNPSLSRFLRSVLLTVGTVTVALAALPGASWADTPRLPVPEEIPAVEAIVVVPDFGEFTIRFNRADAPNHVSHFLVLAHEGLFDGLEFHRVIPGYLVQTGDPATRPDSTGARPTDDSASRDAAGPGYDLPPEETTFGHARGTVSMAWRGNRPGSAATQWFVTLDDIPALDGWATPIGRVVAGLDVLERVAQSSAHRDRRPLHPVRVGEIRLNAETPAGADPAGVSELSEDRPTGKEGAQSE